jgi:hypothetical protein
MSASLAPFGLRPIYHPSGVVRPRGLYQGIATGYATDLYQGTPVLMTTSGVLNVAVNGSDMIGVFDGVEYVDSNGRRQYVKRWTASTAPTGTDWIAYYYEDPAIVYEIQCNGSLAQTSIGDQLNFDATQTAGSGNNTTQLSSAAASSTLAGAAAQGMLRILTLSQYVDNAWGDAFTIVQVQIARHQQVSNKVAF